MSCWVSTSSKSSILYTSQTSWKCSTPTISPSRATPPSLQASHSPTLTRKSAKIYTASITIQGCSPCDPSECVISWRSWRATCSQRRVHGSSRPTTMLSVRHCWSSLAGRMSTWSSTFTCTTRLLVVMTWTLMPAWTSSWPTKLDTTRRLIIVRADVHVVFIIILPH